MEIEAPVEEDDNSVAVSLSNLDLPELQDKLQVRHCRRCHCTVSTTEQLDDLFIFVLVNKFLLNVVLLY
jgi:hypothetical protein